MSILLTIALVFGAGTAAAFTLGRLAPGLSYGVKGALVLGGFGGVIIGLLKDHITGAHHNMSGHDMPGMTMAPATDPSVMLSNVLWGGAGGVVFLILACIIGKLVPNKPGS